MPDLAVAAGQHTFEFQGSLKSGSLYSVSVKSQPGAPPQTCFLTHATGILEKADVTDVTVKCKPEGSFAATGSLHEARIVSAIQRLPSGRILVAGGLTGANADVPIASSEIFDPATGLWSVGGPLSEPRYGGCSAVLPNGEVLYTGGTQARGVFSATAELYDEAKDTWTPTAIPMAQRRTGATCTMLPSGKVLVAGGGIDDLLAAELYDPGTKSFTSTGSMHTGRWLHQATLLDSGKVLVVGGCTDQTGPCVNTTASAELYDPATGTWTVAGSLPSAVVFFALAQISVPVTGGGSARRVLVAGGCQSYPNGCANPGTQVALYDPSADSWSVAASLPVARSDSVTPIVLSSGDVLLVNGGYYTGATGTVRYDVTDGVWATGPETMIDHRAVEGGIIQLADGRWLVVGGAYRIGPNPPQLYWSGSEIFTE